MLEYIRARLAQSVIYSRTLEYFNGTMEECLDAVMS